MATNRADGGYRGRASYKVPHAITATEKMMFKPTLITIVPADIANSIIRIHHVDSSWKYHMIRTKHTGTDASLIFNFVLVPSDSVVVAATALLPAAVAVGTARPILTQMPPAYGDNIYLKSINAIYSDLIGAGTEIYRIAPSIPVDLAIQVTTASTGTIPIVVSSEWWVDGASSQ